LPCLVIVGSANEIDVENNPPLPLETKRIEYGTVANKEGSSSNNTAAVPDSTTVPQLKTSK
jgi:hypothetical protein